MLVTTICQYHTNVVGGEKSGDYVNGSHLVEYTYYNDGLLIGAGNLAFTLDPANGLLIGTDLSELQHLC